MTAVIAGVGWTSALSSISLPDYDGRRRHRRAVERGREDRRVAGARDFGDADFVAAVGRIDADQVAGLDPAGSR